MANSSSGSNMYDLNLERDRRRGSGRPEKKMLPEAVTARFHELSAARQILAQPAQNDADSRQVYYETFPQPTTGEANPGRAA